MNSTQQLLDLAAAHQGKVSDYRLAKRSGYAQNTVSKWRTGRAAMSPSAIKVFCGMAGIQDVARWQVLIGAERDVGVDGEWFRDMRTEIEAAERDGKPIAGGIIEAFIRSIKAASVLLGSLAMLAHVEDARAAGILVVSEHPAPAAAAGDLTENIHYAKYASWLARARRWLRSLFASPHAYTWRPA